MVKKKKKDSVNAIDKYIKQIKYRSECKKPEKTKIRQPKVVISRIRTRRLQDFIDRTEPERKENKTLNVKAPVENKRLMRATRNGQYQRETRHKTKTVTENEKAKISRPRKVKMSACKLKTSESNSNQTKKTSINDLRKSRKKIIGKKGLPADIEMAKEKSDEKSKKTSPDGSNAKRNLKKSSPGIGAIVKAKIKKITTKSLPSSASSEINENVLVAAEEPIPRNPSIQTESREDILPTEESSQHNPLSNEPCLCEPSNFGIGDFSEPDTVTRESLIPNKYKSCVEELKSLTAESITKFVKDNQQYYIDFRKAGHVRKVTANGKKKPKNEFKDSFKCNPFDSAQQVAMYLALRDIFHVPADSFLECRNFFTLLIPEICCQLFAKVFKIKTSFAPRLIKKFYSKPVCLV